MQSKQVYFTDEHAGVELSTRRKKKKKEEEEEEEERYTEEMGKGGVGAVLVGPLKRSLGTY